MNRRIHIAWGVSFFAIACLLTFQGFWLVRTFYHKKAEYLNMVNNVLVQAVETGFEEHLVRNQTIRQNLPRFGLDLKQERIFFVVKGDTTLMNYENDISYLGAIRKVCYDLINQQSRANIMMLDSICHSYFVRSGITDSYILELVDIGTGKIIATTENGSSEVSKSIVSNMIELGIKSHHGLIAYFGMPYGTFFMQMTGVLIGSFVMLVLLVICSMYQVKTISFQNGVAKIREDFMNSMVHELKAPLNRIEKGCVAVVRNKDSKINEKQVILLDSVLAQIQQLNNFVYKLLSGWKQGFRVTWKKLNLHDAIDGVARQFSPELTGKDLSIKVDYQLSIDTIVADPIHLPNVINNLVENAIKYSGDKPEIEVSCRGEGEMIIISVKDNGIGIPEKFRDKIFERYFRVSGSKSSVVHGFGIGLSYVKQVVEAHGGVIRVDSTVGIGTTFTVMIPLVDNENN